MNRICQLVVFLSFIGILVGCGSDSSDSKEKAEVAQELHRNCPAFATYELTFTSLWNAGDHGEMPTGAHFSSLVISVHTEDYALFPIDELTGPALEPVAELGVTTQIEAKLKSEASKGTVENYLIGENQSVPATPVKKYTVKVFSTKASLLSLVSMIAPSPDWVVGVDSLELLNEEGNFIEDTGDIDLFAYDAGTEEGDSFTIHNEATPVPTPIARLSGDGFTEPFARLRLKKIN